MHNAARGEGGGILGEWGGKVAYNMAI